MADVRVTTGTRSRLPGTQVGVQLNTFGMSRLEAGVTGEAIVDILLKAMGPSFDQAVSEWPVQTGASRDSISLDVVEAAAVRARVVLQAGGEKLINDSRNVSHKDYAPFIEFNGTATAPPGILLNSVFGRDAEIRDEVHSGVTELVRGLVSGG